MGRWIGVDIQLFWERLSEKVHATILKGIVGDFKCTVFQRNLKESYGRPLIYVCECWRKVTKAVSTATVVRNSVLIISHITFRDCRVHFILDKLSRNSCIPRCEASRYISTSLHRPWGDSCFSIYQIRWIKKCRFINGHNFFFWNFRETTRHFSLRSQNSEYPRILQVTGANQTARKLLSTDLVNTKSIYTSYEGNRNST